MALLLGTPAASAAVFPVTNTDDAGAGSLRAAITGANGNGNLETDQIPINTTGIVNLQSALPTLDGPMTISGPGPASFRVRRSIGAYRVFGIVVNDAAFTTTIEGLTVSDGVQGIDLAGAGSVVVKDVLVRSNVNTVIGGGVVASNGVDNPSVSIIDSTIQSNQANSGGGVYINGASLEVVNSTIAGNSATFNGGGIFVGGVSPVTLASSTIAGNIADSENLAGGDGGGTYNVTTSPTGFRVANTIFSGNVVGTSTPTPNTQCGGPSVYTSLGHNLRTVADPGCSGFTGAGDIVSPNALLGPLADNGGPTETMALLPGSPAIDAGDPAAPGSGFPACPAADQRGSPRGGPAEPCDIGAFESVLHPPPTTPVTPILNPDPPAAPQQIKPRCRKGFHLKKVKTKSGKKKKKCVRKKKRRRR